MPEKGLKYVARTTVGADNTALAMGSGDMEVFATPAMVALMEHAAMYAVAADLPEGSTTVGASMETTHVRPSAVGAVIAAEAELVETEGRRLTFRVAAFDGAKEPMCVISWTGPNSCRSFESASFGTVSAQGRPETEGELYGTNL